MRPSTIDASTFRRKEESEKTRNSLLCFLNVQDLWMLDRLPPEIQIIIIQLTLHDCTTRQRSLVLRRLCLVNRRLVDLVQHELLRRVEIVLPSQLKGVLEFVRGSSDRMMAVKELKIGVKHRAHPFKIGLMSYPALQELSLVNVGNVLELSVFKGKAMQLRSLSLAHLTIDNTTHTQLRALVFPLLTSLSLLHVSLPAAAAAVLLRPSTLPALTSLALRLNPVLSPGIEAAFTSISGQLISLSIDLVANDPFSSLISTCHSLRLLEHFPTPSRPNLLELYDRPLRYLQLNSKTAANDRSVVKAHAEIEMAFQRGQVAVSELEAIYVTKNWEGFPYDRAKLKELCESRGVELRDCDGAGGISMPIEWSDDYR